MSKAQEFSPSGEYLREDLILPQILSDNFSDVP
jgi:hypothetical protein